MSKEFCLGLALGMIGGAIFVSNSKKLRNIILEGQTKVMKNLNKTDEKTTAQTNYSK